MSIYNSITVWAFKITNIWSHIPKKLQYPKTQIYLKMIWAIIQACCILLYDCYQLLQSATLLRTPPRMPPGQFSGYEGTVRVAQSKHRSSSRDSVASNAATRWFRVFHHMWSPCCSCRIVPKPSCLYFRQHASRVSSLGCLDVLLGWHSGCRIEVVGVLFRFQWVFAQKRAFRKFG